MIVHVVGLLVSTSLSILKYITITTHIAYIISSLIVFFIIREYIERKGRREEEMRRVELGLLRRM